MSDILRLQEIRTRYERDQEKDLENAHSNIAGAEQFLKQAKKAASFSCRDRDVEIETDDPDSQGVGMVWLGVSIGGTQDSPFAWADAFISVADALRKLVR